MRLVYALSDTSVVMSNGLSFRLNRGEAWDADDPLVKEHPHNFSPTPPRARTSTQEGWVVVEQATAAPGERRRTR